MIALSNLIVPSEFDVELLIVDNGSTDETQALLSNYNSQIGELSLVILTEPQKGKSRALNRALAVATGEIILFTDDDVLPPANWISGMCESILEGDADAVAGGLRLGLQMDVKGVGEAQRSWLATTEYCQRTGDPPLIGANMAISRRVLSAVPWFDPEVGPGAIGHAEDTLFWLQVRAAGFRILARYDVIAEHNPDPLRAYRSAMAQLAKKRGEFAAYVDYHWNGIRRRHPYAAVCHSAARLWYTRLARLPQWISSPVMEMWEMELLEEFHFRCHLLVERRRPANYDRNGLVKRAGVLPVKPHPSSGDLPYIDKSE